MLFLDHEELVSNLGMVASFECDVLVPLIAQLTKLHVQSAVFCLMNSMAVRSVVLPHLCICEHHSLEVRRNK